MACRNTGIVGGMEWKTGLDLSSVFPWSAHFGSVDSNVDTQLPLDWWMCSNILPHKDHQCFQSKDDFISSVYSLSPWSVMRNGECVVNSDKLDVEQYSCAIDIRTLVMLGSVSQQSEVHYSSQQCSGGEWDEKGATNNAGNRNQSSFPLLPLQMYRTCIHAGIVKQKAGMHAGIVKQKAAEFTPSSAGYKLIGTRTNQGYITRHTAHILVSRTNLFSSATFMRISCSVSLCWPALCFDLHTYVCAYPPIVLVK